MANATIQQRLVPVRLFYDFLIEEGVRESNPVGQERYTPSRKAPRMVKLPWIPTERDGWTSSRSRRPSGHELPGVRGKNWPER
jgi:hypothetical protein